MSEAAHAAAARAWRDESGRILPGLIRLLGDWGAAEEALQDALETALRRWPEEGVPERSGAWLTTTARRRADGGGRKVASSVSASAAP